MIGLHYDVCMTYSKEKARTVVGPESVVDYRVAHTDSTHRRSVTGSAQYPVLYSTLQSFH